MSKEEKINSPNKRVVLPKKIECIFYDFDGVMTDNRVLIDMNGNECVFVNRSDGMAVSRIKALGIPQIIVSTETNPVVEARARKLNLSVIHGVEDKGRIIKVYCEENEITPANTVFIGNDLNDLSAFEVVGFKGAPADAEIEILAVVDWISSFKGGYGVVRDFYRMCQREWE